MQAFRTAGKMALLAMLLVLSAALVRAQPGNGLPPEADLFHLVLLVVGDTDKGIGGACLNDCKAMAVALKTAFAADKNRLVIHDLTRKNPATKTWYSGKEVLDHLRKMKIGTNDTVVVFHSGHGGIGDAKRPEKTHTLSIDGGSVNRGEICQVVMAKKPRAYVILTDCCSTLAEPAPEPEEEPCAAEKLTVNVQTVRRLLLKPVGVVSVTAAQDGKEAMAGFEGHNPGQAGSAFTVALMRLWYNQDTTYSTWKQFFPALRAETGKASGGRHLARAFQLPK
jgi:hypothetical protein